MKRRSNGNLFGGCFGVVIGFLLISLTVGGVCFVYMLNYLFGKDVPWYADAVAGLFLGSLTMPGTVICLIMSLCDVVGPVFPG